jgi:hypothetical protein
LISLDTLALQYGTDKGSRNHNYTRHYDALFASRRQEPITFLELGVQEGASLRMWRDYFPKAALLGVDIDERCLASADDRISIHIGDQSDPVFLNDLTNDFGPFDIVIDDASHNGDASRLSFGLLYPRLKPGGFYIVEDLHTAYFGWGSSFVEYVKELLDEVVWPGGKAFSHGHGDPRNHENWETIRGGMSEFSRQTKQVIFLSSLIVFEKWPAGEVF